MKTIYPTLDPSLPSLELKDIPKMPPDGLHYTLLLGTFYFDNVTSLEAHILGMPLGYPLLLGPLV
jgi:hypothetical protein